MRRIILIFVVVIAALLFTSIFVALGQTTPTDNIIQPPQRILTTNDPRGILNNDTFFVFGPDICTAYGDPYSPANSRFTDEHPYSYRYRIVIPPDYEDDVLRIELFDPDSINQDIISTTVSYSNLAIANGYSSTPELLGCPNLTTQEQIHVCLIDTEEYSLTLTTPGIDFSQVNPNWYVRVDENRGSGATGVCRQPTEYTPAYNTATYFTLSYDRQNSDGTVTPIQLANYTGQVGDGIRDNGDHQTDLHWISPGGTQSSDQPALVPVDPGSNTDFELNLVQDLPNITIDPVTNERIVYLDVTSLSGASKNNFAVWAGPDDDVAAIPSNVNERNLYILNNPDVHHSQGVQILAERSRPLHALFDRGMDVPIMHLGPEYAGLTTTISIFDPDTGSMPPINFYLDTLAYTPDDSEDGFDETQTDWAISFGETNDPNSGCFTDPGNYSYECQDIWVNYTITMPTDLGCDGAAENCTPFYGGQLMARFNGGSINGLYDATVWEVDGPPPLTYWDDTEGCSAFPIAVDENIRSVSIATNSENRWRTDFDYPASPSPDYYSFVDHIPEIPLLDAKPGYLYNIQNGQSSGGKGWLAWNQCTASASDLQASLTWPGNSKDYSPHPGQCAVNGEVMPIFAGFMEFGDNSDKSMHVDDWVTINTGSTSSSGIRDTLREHVDLDRVLRVIVYDDIMGSGGSAGYKISRFALMRLIGYSMSSGGGESFMMAEFIGWDDSCGQVALPHSVGGNGPGGVGDTDGTTNLALWLQADEDTLTDEACTLGTEASANETVACWVDQSGNDNHATETANGPTLVTAVVNNQPTLYFNRINYLDNEFDLNGRSGFTFFEAAGAATESGYQSILRFQDAADSSIVYPDGNQLSLSSDTSVNAGFVPGELNIGTAVYQLNTTAGMKTYHDGTLVASADTGTTPLPADSLTIGRNNATQADYANAGVSELIVFDRELSSVERILVENYLSAKYAQPIANDKFDGDDPANDNFDMDVAGIGRDENSLHTSAASKGMIVVNQTFLQDPGDYLLFGHRMITNNNGSTDMPEGGDWDSAPDPQRWLRYWYIDVTDEGSHIGGFVTIIFDLSDAGMTGLPNGDASNYRLLKREGISDIFADIATAISIEGDRIIFENVNVSLLGSNFTLGTLDAGTSPTAISLETAVVQSTAPTLLIILILIALLSVPTCFVIRRQKQQH